MLYEVITEQLAFIASGGGDGDFQLVQMIRPRYCGGLLLGSQTLQLGTTGFKRRDVLRSGRSGLASYNFV